MPWPSIWSKLPYRIRRRRLALPSPVSLLPRATPESRCSRDLRHSPGERTSRIHERRRPHVHANPCRRRYETIRNSRHRSEGAQRQFKCSRQICGAVFVRQRENLFFGQAEFAGLLIVSDVTTCSLRGQPLAHITLIRLCLRGKLRRVIGPRARALYSPSFSPITTMPA